LNLKAPYFLYPGQLDLSGQTGLLVLLGLEFQLYQLDLLTLKDQLVQPDRHHQPGR
jgi:hypothetical protein